MPLNPRYLKELSEMFVDDLRRSDYYRQLTAAQRKDLDDRIREETDHGYYPLLPGADTTDLARLSSAMYEELNVQLPNAKVEILRQVDGFVANGVTLYGVDGDLRDDKFDAVPGLLAENLVHWSSYPETMQRYLFIGDADLWHFGIELGTGRPLALAKGTLSEAHEYSTLEELVYDMLRQALRHFEDRVEETDPEPEDYSAGYYFSRS
jgi:hypothetical protein